eukprot:FR736464.1.p1 GENE.FR736464.1~~FR736464.1.p1  ORF type:complete len:198 (+),score=8.05 FR736464.1:138-731(+)
MQQQKDLNEQRELQEELLDAATVCHALTVAANLPNLPTAHDVRTIMRRLGNNCVALHAEMHNEAEVVAWAFYQRAAMLNHSCRPNCYWEFEDTVMRVRTSRTVAKDEELETSYLPLEVLQSPVATRAQQLWFRCECTQCVSERCSPMTFRINKSQVWYGQSHGSRLDTLTTETAGSLAVMHAMALGVNNQRVPFRPS